SFVRDRRPRYRGDPRPARPAAARADPLDRRERGDAGDDRLAAHRADRDRRGGTAARERPRAPEPGDRRALSIALTPEGRALFDERYARAAEAFAPATASLSAAERRTLLALLEQMTDALRDGNAGA